MIGEVYIITLGDSRDQDRHRLDQRLSGGIALYQPGAEPELVVFVFELSVMEKDLDRLYNN